jgi:PAS domain S-box-containing protein
VAQRRIPPSGSLRIVQQDAAGSHEPESPPAGAAAPPADEPSISLELARAAMNGLSDAVIVTDLEGRLLHFNRAADRLLPLGMMEMPLSEWSVYGGFLGPDMRTPFPAAELPLLRALRGEAVDDCEIYLPGTRGPEGRWISVSSRPVIDGNRRIVGGVTAVRDITARKRQLERHHLLSKIVEETADAVLVTNSMGEIVYVNAAFERTTGFSRADVLGENPRVLKSGLHSRNFYEELWTRLLRGEVYRGTLIDRRKNGEVYLSSQTITPLRTPDGAISHMVSIARDLTRPQDDADRGDDLRLGRSVANQLFPGSPERADASDA